MKSLWVRADGGSKNAPIIHANHSCKILDVPAIYMYPVLKDGGQLV
jgi:hypothetical protein